ncbi:MAG TPA: hypothetical protein VLT61_03330, partial [Anaeromyxobacteraceae bacterium]|nr:hypothetical protein [Anaeromyxobacteraceae bacterium]
MRGEHDWRDGIAALAVSLALHLALLAFLLSRSTAPPSGLPPIDVELVYAEPQPSPQPSPQQEPEPE